MKRSGLLFLGLLIACANYAFARQGADGLNEQQRLGRQLVAQACGVCHLPPARNARTYGPLLNKAAGGGDDAVGAGELGHHEAAAGLGADHAAEDGVGDADHGGEDGGGGDLDGTDLETFGEHL